MKRVPAENRTPGYRHMQAGYPFCCLTKIIYIKM